MIGKELIRLFKCFPNSTVNRNGEFIAHEKTNVCFNVGNVNDVLELKCKVLEWFSRAAYKAEPWRDERKNRAYRHFFLKGINDFLGTDFDQHQIGTIYAELGNSVNRQLTIKFIESNYDFEVLKER